MSRNSKNARLHREARDKKGHTGVPFVARKGKKSYTRTSVAPTTRTLSKHDLNRVAAVCGDEVRLYGGVDPRSGRRPLEHVWRYGTRGRALQVAHSFNHSGE